MDLQNARFMRPQPQFDRELLFCGRFGTMVIVLISEDVQEIAESRYRLAGTGRNRAGRPMRRAPETRRGNGEKTDRGQ